MATLLQPDASSLAEGENRTQHTTDDCSNVCNNDILMTGGVAGGDKAIQSGPCCLCVAGIVAGSSELSAGDVFALLSIEWYEIPI